MLQLKCEICGCDYEKSEDFKMWNDKKRNVFFEWNLKYCDVCRRKKEIESLKKLPKIIDLISKQKP